jgi:hypothetical protein
MGTKLRRNMKIKLIIATILFAASTTAMAVGPVLEQIPGSTKTISCDPPTTRAPNSEGVQVPITIEELDFSTITVINEDTTIAETATADVFCGRVLKLDEMSPGQYKIVATVTDTDNRESALSDPYYFLLIPTVQPPNAPTGITLQ